MKKILNWCWEHKLLVLFLILIAVILIFLVKLVFVFTESDEVAIYGNRLEGEKKINLNISDTNTKVKEALGDSVKSVSVRKQGRILNVYFVVNDDVSRDTAKDLGNKTVASLTDEERGYYDIQIYANKDAEDAQFPIVGYKHHTRDGITWTKDR